MKSFVPLVLVFASSVSSAQDVALKAGEKADLFPVYWVASCKSLLKSFAGVDVLGGPPDVQASLREEPVPARRQGCPDKVPGAVLVLAASPDAKAFEGSVRVRVRYVTEDGDKQSVHTVKLLVLPKD